MVPAVARVHTFFLLEFVEGWAEGNPFHDCSFTERGVLSVIARTRQAQTYEADHLSRLHCAYASVAKVAQVCGRT